MSALYCLATARHLGDGLQFQVTAPWVACNKSGDWSGLRWVGKEQPARFPPDPLLEQRLLLVKYPARAVMSWICALSASVAVEIMDIVLVRSIGGPILTALPVFGKPIHGMADFLTVGDFINFIRVGRSVRTSRSFSRSH